MNTGAIDGHIIKIYQNITLFTCTRNVIVRWSVEDVGSGGRLSGSVCHPPVTMVTWKRTGHTGKISGKWMKILRTETLILVYCETCWGMTHSGARGGHLSGSNSCMRAPQPGEGASPGHPVVQQRGSLSHFACLFIDYLLINVRAF